MLLLPVELHDALEVGVNHGAEVELLLPDLFLLVLGANKVLGDASLDDRPARPFAGRLGQSDPEATLESGRDAAIGASFAESGIRVDLSWVLKPIRHCRLQHLLHRQHLRRHRHCALLAPGLHGFRGRAFLFNSAGGLL